MNFVLILNLHNEQFFFLKFHIKTTNWYISAHGLNLYIVDSCLSRHLCQQPHYIILSNLFWKILHQTFSKKIAIRIFKRCLGSRLDQNPFKIVQEIWSIWIIGVWITEASLYTMQTNFSIKKITLWFQPYLMPSAFEH